MYTEVPSNKTYIQVVSNNVYTDFPSKVCVNALFNGTYAVQQHVLCSFFNVVGNLWQIQLPVYVFNDGMKIKQVPAKDLEHTAVAKLELFVKQTALKAMEKSGLA